MLRVFRGCGGQSTSPQSSHVHMPREMEQKQSELEKGGCDVLRCYMKRNSFSSCDLKNGVCWKGSMHFVF